MAYKEHDANGVYFGRVLSNLELCLASLTNSYFNVNKAVRERGPEEGIPQADFASEEDVGGPQLQSVVCVLRDCLERTAKPGSDFHGLFQTILR